MSYLGAQNSIALGVQGLIHIDTGVVGSADYLLAKSLRFRSSASAYLSRTPATATNQKTWTWSGWVKRGTFSASSVFGTQSAVGGVPRASMGFTSDAFDIQFNPTGSAWSVAVTTSQVFRDPAAWYHFVIAIDTTQGTASDRLKFYVNGSQVTAFSTATYPTASLNLPINLNQAHQICADGIGTSAFDGELAEVNFVDGQALAPTAFGASSTYNQWLPIRYAGAYGTNGFYLPFTNTTSTSTLVADSSGNANNWTPNNISLTAGSTYDSLTDVPTLTSTTVANYAVLNPLDSANPALSTNGNLTWTNPATSHLGIRGSIAIPTAGAFYIEAINVVANSANAWIGFGLAASTVSLTTNMAGTSANSFNFYSGGSASAYIYSGTSLLATLSAFSANDVVQIAVDVTNTKMWLGKNNVWYNSTGGTTGNPTTGANPTFTTSMVGLFLMIEAGGPGGTTAVNMNFGQQPFTYSAPTGFLPLNTFNI